MLTFWTEFKSQSKHGQYSPTKLGFTVLTLRLSKCLYKDFTTDVRTETDLKLSTVKYTDTIPDVLTAIVRDSRSSFPKTHVSDCLLVWLI